MDPSRLFLYYNSRKLGGCHTLDEGVRLDFCLESLLTIGICRESLWPYTSSIFDKPSKIAYANTKVINGFRPIKVNIKTFKGILLLNNLIVFGMAVKKRFETLKSEIMELDISEEIVGYHAVVCCGYSNQFKAIRIMNSWGTDWGDNGLCWLSYEYLESGLCSDAFIIY